MTDLTTWPGRPKPTDEILDAGILYVGATPAAFGAFRGGLSFNPGITWRESDWDGKTTSIAGTERIVEYNPTITGKVKDVSAALLQQLEPGSTKTTAAGPPSTDTITPLPASTVLDGTTGYLTDVRMVHLLASGKLEEVHFPVAKVTGYKLSAQDKNEGEWDITIKAYLAASETDTTKCPYEHIITTPA